MAHSGIEPSFFKSSFQRSTYLTKSSTGSTGLNLAKELPRVDRARNPVHDDKMKTLVT